MAIPNDIDARCFYRSAKERLEDAQVLLGATPKRTTGTVYLAGYSVECLLKALILSSEPPARHAETLESFRGSKAHSFDWLREQYQLRSGQVFSREIRNHFRTLNSWGTSLRYVPATFSDSQANRFLKASEAFLVWAESRL
ncbi:MAG: HEPN domain-containing protein [Planctomycetaceae bacterium]